MGSDRSAVKEFKAQADLALLLERIKSVFGQSVDLSKLLPMLVDFLLSYSDFRNNKIDRGGYLHYVLRYLANKGLNVRMDLGRIPGSDVVKELNKLFRKRIKGWTARHTYEVLKRLYQEEGYHVEIRQDRSGKWFMSYKKKDKPVFPQAQEKEPETFQEEKTFSLNFTVEKRFSFISTFYEETEPMKKAEREDTGLKSEALLRELEKRSYPKVVKKPRR